MIRAHELARLLLSGPNVPVVTWQGSGEPTTEGCDSDVEQVFRALDFYGDPIVIIGMELPVSLLADEETEALFGDGPGLAKAVDVYRCKVKKAAGE